MNMSNSDISVLRTAVQNYQAAVRKRDEDERARAEAARLEKQRRDAERRLRHEEHMKAIGSFFHGLSVLAGVAIVIYILYIVGSNIDWNWIGATIKDMFNVALGLLGLFLVFVVIVLCFAFPPLGQFIIGIIIAVFMWKTGGCD